ncbi:MAG: DNA-binding response regulator [Candidatus Sulfotelmatobacter sp.]
MKATPALKPLIRVAVANGDPLRFVGLRALLSEQTDIELSCVDPSEITVDHNIDVVLLWNNAGKNTFDAMAGCRTRDVKLPIVVAGNRMDDAAMYRAIVSGAKGCIEEEAPATTFARAFRAVHAGSVWVPRRVLSMVVERSNAMAKFGPQPFSQAFTSRECEVLELLVAGRSNKEIGDPLGIEERTVKAHVSKLMRKVGVQNRIALSMHAITHSLVSRS